MTHKLAKDIAAQAIVFGFGIRKEESQHHLAFDFE